VVSNPRGYSGERVDGFRPDFTLELERLSEPTLTVVRSRTQIPQTPSALLTECAAPPTPSAGTTDKLPDADLKTVFS
jgi:hypothetical protein